MNRHERRQRRRLGLNGRTTRLPTWLCQACGHTCDAASSLFHDVGPSDGDFCICIACTAVSVFQGGKVELFADFDGLDPRELFEIRKTQAAIRDMHATIGPPRGRTGGTA